MPEEALQQWGMDLDTAGGFITERWQKVKSCYNTFHARIWRNRLFYCGNTWIERYGTNSFWETKRTKEVDTPCPEINEFAPAIDAVASNFSNVPDVEAVANDQDDERAQSVSRIVNELIRYAEKDNSISSDGYAGEDRASKAAQDFVLSGNSIAHVYMSEGLPKVELLPTELVFPAPGAQSIDDADWLIIARRMSVSKIKSRYGIEAKPDGERADGFDVAGENALEIWVNGYGNAGNDFVKAALVLECYIRPGVESSLPEGGPGAHIVYVNHQAHIVEPVDYRYGARVLKADYIPVPGLFFGRTSANDIAVLQEELNRYESIIALHGMVSAADPILIEESTKVTNITGFFNKIVYWKRTAPDSVPPSRLQHGSLDAGIFEKRRELLEAIQRVSAVSAVWRGDTPGSGVTASSAIAQLREQAELQFSKPTQNWNNFWGDVIRRTVCMYQESWPLQKYIEVLGDGDITAIEAFIQSDLNRDIDFRITRGGQPKTRTARREEMLLLFDKGMADPNDPAVKQELFELFGESGVMAAFNADSKRARNNLLKIKQGELAFFRPGIDDPQIHVSIYLEAAKALDFDQWPPEVQEALFGLIQACQAQMAQMAAMMQPVQGADAPAPQQAMQV